MDFSYGPLAIRFEIFSARWAAVHVVLYNVLAPLLLLSSCKCVHHTFIATILSCSFCFNNDKKRRVVIDVFHLL
jgi:hypothetical protein